MKHLAKKKSKKQARKEARKKELRAEKKKDLFFKLGIFLVVIIIVAVWIYFASRPAYIPQPAGPSSGPDDAQVVFLQFGCFTCPLTQQFNLNVLPTLMEEYGDEVKFVFRSVPIYSNQGAGEAHVASKCADDQGFFWEYSQSLFRGGPYTQQSLITRAVDMGMDEDEFAACLNSGIYEEVVREDYLAAQRARITLTPTVFINDVRLNGAFEIGLYRRVLDDVIADAAS